MYKKCGCWRHLWTLIGIQKSNEVPTVPKPSPAEMEEVSLVNRQRRWMIRKGWSTAQLPRQCLETSKSLSGVNILRTRLAFKNSIVRSIRIITSLAFQWDARVGERGWLWWLPGTSRSWQPACLCHGAQWVPMNLVLLIVMAIIKYLCALLPCRRFYC